MSGCLLPVWALALLGLALLTCGACLGVGVMCLAQINRERPSAVFPTPEESEL